jgi:hypothetical protein
MSETRKDQSNPRVDLVPLLDEISHLRGEISVTNLGKVSPLTLRISVPILETVSTTCGSGGCAAFYSRRMATHPSTTTGGTDCLKLSA